MTSPIERYGLVGDTRTAALVGPDGSIDWLCLHRFDGAPVFGRLVGGDAAGCFAITPAVPYQVRSHEYEPRTATVVTTWSVDGAEVELRTAMLAELGEALLPQNLLVRQVAVRGTAPVRVRLLLDPRLGEEHRPPRVERRGDRVVMGWRGVVASVEASPRLALVVGKPVEVVVEPGHPLVVAVSFASHGPLVHVPADAAAALVRDDERRWRDWSARVECGGELHEAVVRSLLTLRLLTYSPSGAPVAAPTTSLPEELGGSRNWDYRYAWPRDASIGVGAFLGCGLVDEARSFLYWLLHASRLDRPRLPVLLTLDGTPAPDERTWPGWPGYGGSAPVRVGNDARHQHQLDGYGWVVDAAALLDDEGQGLFSETVRMVAALTDEVARTWRDPDAGVWEIRGEPRQYVHSKLMAWLALDRAAGVGERHGLKPARTARWQAERDALRADLLAHGVDRARSTLVQSYGSTDLDAALLLLPLIGMLDADDPLVAGTVDAVRSELSAGGSLLYRYRPGTDGLDGREGAFLPCSGWLAQALALTGRRDEAEQVLHDVVALSGPLGLLAEEADPTTGWFLGNHPQALSHAALVQAVLALRSV
jgi:GH15 family glucan-1,4-alpha-glucosidase